MHVNYNARRRQHRGLFGELMLLARREFMWYQQLFEGNANRQKTQTKRKIKSYANAVHFIFLEMTWDKRHRHNAKESEGERKLFFVFAAAEELKLLWICNGQSFWFRCVSVLEKRRQLHRFAKSKWQNDSWEVATNWKHRKKGEIYTLPTRLDNIYYWNRRKERVKWRENAKRERTWVRDMNRTVCVCFMWNGATERIVYIRATFQFVVVQQRKISKSFNSNLFLFDEKRPTQRHDTTGPYDLFRLSPLSTEWVSESIVVHHESLCVSEMDFTKAMTSIR